VDLPWHDVRRSTFLSQIGEVQLTLLQILKEDGNEENESPILAPKTKIFAGSARSGSGVAP